MILAKKSTPSARRHGVRVGLKLLYIATAIVVASSIFAQEHKYVEGTHYLRVPTEFEKKNNEKIEVIEFFSYGCIHCYRFEKPLQTWLENKPEDVEFSRQHVVFARSWIPLARAYYVAEQLDVSSEITPRMFKAIHDHRLDMSRKELLVQLFENVADVKEEKFESVYSSFGIQGKLRETINLLQVWRIEGVPSIIVDGRYLIDTNTSDNDHTEFMNIVSFVVEKVRAERDAEKT